MTSSQTLDRLEALCREGVGFEQALEQAGFVDCPLSITALLFKYWKMLEMEHAFAASNVYFDRLLEKTQ